MRKALVAVFVATFWLGVEPAFGATWAVKGTVITPDEVIEDAAVEISGEKISAVGKNVGKASSEIKTDGVILPGLIDLHDHIVWNVFARWRPGRKFSNRYEWQATPEYNRAMSAPESAMIADHEGCDAELFSEVKALSGGATSVVGSFSITDQNACMKGLARNLDFYSGLPEDTPAKVAYEVFPFEKLDEMTEYRKRLASGTLKAVLIHLAEEA